MHLDTYESVVSAIKQLIAQEFSIGHVTVQLERAGLPAQPGYVMPERAEHDSRANPGWRSLVAEHSRGSMPEIENQ
jgi:hypothetical protein